MSSISENCSLFEIDNELDTLLEQIEEQVETEGEPSEELLSRFREFCAAHGEKVDRIGRFVRMMEAHVLAVCANGNSCVRCSQRCHLSTYTWTNSKRSRCWTSGGYVRRPDQLLIGAPYD
jgi:hypothetical protein